ncbi:hypothetical protein M6B38_392210 [Iris pallida]|uniref:Uncharacterized protein n=1 Tax=Iris pallida TaxID=29817 RepID=A0AAX6FZD2_IRIPA|nr:hypothetical protein M6B38_392210 [Iris pallida]
MLFVQVEPRRMASLKALKEPIKASDDVPKAQISKPVLKTAETKPKPKKKANVSGQVSILLRKELV